MIQTFRSFLRGVALLALLTLGASAAAIITATKDDNIAAHH